jgi:hypothetical protein
MQTRKMILSMKIYPVKDYLDEIITSFENISDKNFVFNFDQNSNHQKNY